MKVWRKDALIRSMICKCRSFLGNMISVSDYDDDDDFDY